jgi:hypothetical protein
MSEWNSKENQLEYLREAVKPSTVVYTRTTYTRSGTGNVQVMIAPKRNDIRDITWMVGKACGLQVRETSNGWVLPTYGAGYNRGQQIYEHLRQATSGAARYVAADQTKWREI